MSMTDPIADLLTRIRNGVHAKLVHVDVPRNRIKQEMARVLRAKGYIRKYILVDDGLQGFIRIYLKYGEDEGNAIRGLRRISRPGRRLYAKASGMPRVRNNLGIAIVSTPKGILTNLECRKANVGGEILCYVW